MPQNWIGQNWSNQDGQSQSWLLPVWNAAGIEPPVCEVLQRIAEVSARVWRGSDIPPHRQGIRVLGSTDVGSWESAV